MEKKFDRQFDALDGIFEFVSGFISKLDTDAGVAYSINLAVEELFTNMVKYNSGTADKILIRMNRDDKNLVLQLVDFDVEPFDPDMVQNVATDQPIDDRRPGGLGLHLVKSIVDRITYEYANRQMTVTVVKRLERSNV